MAPDPALACRRPASNSGVVSQLGNHPHLRCQAMGSSVLHQASMNAVGGAGGTTADVRRVDLDDIQDFGPAALRSLRG